MYSIRTEWIEEATEKRLDLEIFSLGTEKLTPYGGVAGSHVTA